MLFFFPPVCLASRRQPPPNILLANAVCGLFGFSEDHILGYHCSTHTHDPPCLVPEARTHLHLQLPGPLLRVGPHPDRRAQARPLGQPAAPQISGRCFFLSSIRPLHLRPPTRSQPTTHTQIFLFQILILSTAPSHRCLTLE